MTASRIIKVGHTKRIKVTHTDINGTPVNPEQIAVTVGALDKETNTMEVMDTFDKADLTSVTTGIWTKDYVFDARFAGRAARIRVVADGKVMEDPEYGFYSVQSPFFDPV